MVVCHFDPARPERNLPKAINVFSSLDENIRKSRELLPRYKLLPLKSLFLPSSIEFST